MIYRSHNNARKLYKPRRHITPLKHNTRKNLIIKNRNNLIGHINSILETSSKPVLQSNLLRIIRQQTNSIALTNRVKNQLATHKIMFPRTYNQSKPRQK